MKLYAVVSHEGAKLDSGHYYAHICQDGKTWRKFNDSSVEIVPKEQVSAVHWALN